MHIDVNKINLQEWEKLLATSAKSHEKKGPHQYLVLHAGQYRALKKEEFTSLTHKLSLSEIIAISEAKFQELERQIPDFPEALTKGKNYSQLTQHIAFYSQLLVKSRQVKRNQPFNRLLRAVAWVFSALSSLALIGIPFLFHLKRSSNKFSQEMNQLNEKVSNLMHRSHLLAEKNKKMKLTLLEELNCSTKTSEELLNQEGELINRLQSLKFKLANSSSDQDKLALQAEIEQIISYIREVQLAVTTYEMTVKSARHFVKLKEYLINKSELKKELNDPKWSEDIKDFIFNNFHEGWKDHQKLPPEEKSQPAEQFKKDIVRGTKFLRIDQLLKIEDKDFVPSLKLNDKQKLETSLDAIKAVVKDDDSWNLALQLLINQTSLNAAFQAPITYLAIPASEVIWEENGRIYVLLVEFDQGSPPIKVQINRDQTSHKIQSVDLEIVGYLNLTKRASGSDGSVKKEGEDQKNLIDIQKREQVIISKALEGSLNYTVTLNKDGKIEISDIRYHYV